MYKRRRNSTVSIETTVVVQKFTGRETHTQREQDREEALLST